MMIDEQTQEQIDSAFLLAVRAYERTLENDKISFGKLQRLAELAEIRLALAKIASTQTLKVLHPNTKATPCGQGHGNVVTEFQRAKP